MPITPGSAFPNIYEIFDDVPFSVAVLRGPDLVIEYINHFNLSIWQSTRESVIGLPLYVAKPALRQDTEPIHRQIYATGERFQAAEVPIEINGSPGYFQVSIDPIRDKEGSIIGQICTSFDITTQVLARQESEAVLADALKKSQQHMQILRDTVPAMIFYLDKEQRYQTYNETFCKWFGIDREAALGKTVREFVGEATYSKVSPHLDKAYAGQVERYEMSAPARVGEWRYLDIIYTPDKNDAGEVQGVIVLATDVTEQVLNRRKLVEANERATLAIESSGMGTVEVNLLTDDVIFSPRMHEIFESTPGELRPALIDRIHPDDLPIRSKAYERAYQDGILEFEVRLVRKNGNIRWIKVKGRIFFDDAGKPLRLISVVQDITDQRIFAEELERQVRQRTEELQEAHHLLLASNVYLQQIIDIFSAPLQVLQPVIEDDDVVDFVFKQTNTAYAAFTAFTPEELVGKKVGEVFPGYFETDSFRNIREVAMTGISNTWENHYVADGLDIFNLMSAASMNGMIVVHMTDFTRLKALQIELQRKLRELERSNESLEEFAHVASHDLKEPIRKIKIFTDQLKTELLDHVNERQLRLFQRVENASKRMASLIDDMLLYSHVSELPLEKELVNLNETIQLVLEDLELVISQKEAHVHLVDMPVIKGYRRQLQQLFQNLVSNAVKYSKEQVAPVIRISSTIVNGKEVDMEPDRMYHRISVEDNGIGFQEQHADQIFHIFQRLHGKDEYSGTGVGLSIARKVVENHHGKIVATGVPDVGATFYIYIPVS